MITIYVKYTKVYIFLNTLLIMSSDFRMCSSSWNKCMQNFELSVIKLLIYFFNFNHLQFKYYTIL